jgi:hypothetical protein
MKMKTKKKNDKSRCVLIDGTYVILLSLSLPFVFVFVFVFYLFDEDELINEYKMFR